MENTIQGILEHRSSHTRESFSLRVGERAEAANSQQLLEASSPSLPCMAVPGYPIGLRATIPTEGAAC